MLQLSLLSDTKIKSLALRYDKRDTVACGT